MRSSFLTSPLSQNQRSNSVIWITCKLVLTKLKQIKKGINQKSHRKQHQAASLGINRQAAVKTKEEEVFGICRA